MERLIEMKKGQASAEFLVILAVTLVIFIIVFSLISQQMIDTGIQNENAGVGKTISDLSLAIREVYSQGEGASQIVHVVLPSTYDAANSRIVNSTILIRTRETFRVETFSFDVYGTLPQAAGAYDVLVYSRGGSVYVGSSLFRMSPSLVSVIMPQNSTVYRTINITSVTNESITINGALLWSHPEVSLATSGLNFTLAPYEQRQINLTFMSYNMTGSFAGSITFNASSSLFNDSQVLGLYVEVPSDAEAPERRMVVYPTIWNATIARGGSASSVFIVCGINTPLNPVAFQPSFGIPGAWVSGLSPISVSENFCSSKTFNITVPHGTRPRTYYGSVAVYGGSIYLDIIYFSVLVT